MYSLIIFDEISLCITLDDYIAIANYNRIKNGKSYVLFDEDLCFAIIENDIPLAFINFTKVVLEGRECYEISEIKHILNKIPNLPNDLEKFNAENLVLIYSLFDLLSEIIITSENVGSISCKYYIRNKIKGTYSIQAFMERVNLINFIDQLSYGVGVLD